MKPGTPCARREKAGQRQEPDQAAQQKDAAAREELQRAAQAALARAESAEREARELREEAAVMNEALRVGLTRNPMLRISAPLREDAVLIRSCVQYKTAQRHRKMREALIHTLCQQEAAVQKLLLSGAGASMFPVRGQGASFGAVTSACVRRRRPSASGAPARTRRRPN
jgi:hypothetical protein